MSTPTRSLVAPEVIDFGEDDDWQFEKQLDTMIGGEELAIQAVKEEKKQIRRPNPNESLGLAEDLELTFDLDLEGEEEDEDDELPDEANDSTVALSATQSAQLSKEIQNKTNLAVFFGPSSDFAQKTTPSSSPFLSSDRDTDEMLDDMLADLERLEQPDNRVQGITQLPPLS